MKIRIGTRKSKLALVQTELVIKALKAVWNKYEYQIVPIITTGDTIKDKPLYDVGGKALFLKEIEYALERQEIDIGVHSMKDVPGKTRSNLVIASVLEREDPREVLVVNKLLLNLNKGIQGLPHNALFGTSSMRRQAQVNIINPYLKWTILRGNVTTRVDKVKDNIVHATLLAKAGIDRLGIMDENCMTIINEDTVVPAVGQGVIALQARNKDNKVINMCKSINHNATWDLLQVERGFLEYLDADCKTPLAAYARCKDNQAIASFFLADVNNHDLYTKIQLKNIDLRYGYQVGREVAQRILKS